MTTATVPAIGSRFARELPELAVEWQPAAVPEPGLVVVNEALAVEIGIDPAWLSSDEGLAVLAGNAVPPGSTPVAMVYAGHQFGGYAPRLGDGRALLLGELTGPDGQQLDLHLKGSGRTPFARSGDGKATLGPMLREFVISEAMHALGIPTTRSLAVVTTGEQVQRIRLEPGAVLTRVAASHLRVGTFEFTRRLDDVDLLRRLTDHAVARHHPEAADAERPALALLEAVVDAQARLVARWMHVGFIHGVMNTDNTTISGETIDYGPCAFMDRYDPATVFSSIDHGGRYAYGNQPAIAQWNLARLAESLLPLIDDDPATAVELASPVVRSFESRYGDAWRAGMRAKLGLPGPVAGDEQLIDDLLSHMEAESLDFTATFRSLPELSDTEWVGRWQAALREAGVSPEEAADRVGRINPVYVPRNHLVEEALDATVAGDLDPLDRLLNAVRSPYTRRPGMERYAAAAPDGFTERYQTFCGT